MASDPETTTDAASTGDETASTGDDPAEARGGAAASTTEGGGVDDAAIAEGYAAALDELEAILAELEDDGIDVDALAGRVERASELLRYCRERIDEAEMTVERIVTDLDPEESAATGFDDGAAVDDEPDGP